MAVNFEVVVQADEPLAQFLANLSIDRGKGLVEQEDIGTGGEGAGDGNTLALAAGQLMRVTLQQAVQFQQGGQFAHPVGDARLGPFFDFQAEGNVVEAGHVFEQGVVLKDKPDIALLHRHAVDLRAADKNPAAGRVFQTGDHAQDGGFPAAAGAEQTDQFPFVDDKVDVFDRRHPAEVLRDIF